MKNCFASSAIAAKIRAVRFFLHLKASKVEGRRASLTAYQTSTFRADLAPVCVVMDSLGLGLGCRNMFEAFHLRSGKFDASGSQTRFTYEKLELITNKKIKKIIENLLEW